MANLLLLNGFLALWQNAQGPMLREKRWGNFPAYNQTLVEHTNSLPLVARLVTMTVSRQFCLDIVMDCVTVHDHGEPLTGGDQHAGNKTRGKDVEEWIAFAELMQKQPEHLAMGLLYAFSLQYVRKAIWVDLPPEGQRMVSELRAIYAYEATLFDFIERFDYRLSAYAGHLRGIQNQKETMLAHTFGNQAPKLDALVVEIPELGSLWSPQLRAELEALCQS